VSTDAEKRPHSFESELREPQYGRAEGGAAEGTPISGAQAVEFLNTLADPFLILDRDWRFLYANPAVAAIFQGSASPLPGRRFWDVFPDARGVFAPVLERVMQERIPLQSRIHYAQMWLDVHAQPVEAGLSVLLLNVTEQKKRLEELERREKRLRALVENCADGMVMIDRENRIIYAKKTILGYSPSEWIGRHILEMTDLETRMSILPKLRELANHPGATIQGDARVRAADNTWRWVEVVATNLLHEEDVGAILINYRDVTERKESEIALRESRERLNLALEAGRMGAWDWDILSSRITCTEAMERLHGLSPNTFDGSFEAFHRDVHPDDRNSVMEAIQKSLATRSDYQAEYRIMRPDGSHIWIESRGRLQLNEEGVATRMTGICMDITERKRAEEELIRQSHELARSNAELQQFAYVASHDLKEPLRNITCYVQLLAKRTEGRRDDSEEQFIQFIVDGAKRMNDLISDLLAYSRTGSGTEEIHAVSMERVTDLALMNLERMIKESDAVITRDPLPVIPGDEVPLVQLMQNLLSNAIKYRSQERPWIQIHSERVGDYWKFSVRDNGIGFKPEHQDRIFGLFRRLHGREIPGTGIGLAICKKVVEDLGGRIWAESAEGRGSTFSFLVPALARRPAASTHSAQETARTSAAEGEKIHPAPQGGRTEAR